MPTVLKTPRAKADIRQIVRYIAQDNLSAAVDWLDATEALFQLLATQPELGQLRQTSRFKRARRHVHGNYVVYYRPTRDGVEILRVLHGARDERRQV